MIEKHIQPDTEVMKMIPLTWKLGYSVDDQQLPEQFIPSVVPGAVQLDIAREAEYPNYNLSDNYKLFRWMEDMYYTYRSNFNKPQLKAGEKLWFISKGIDFQFEIFINDELIHEQKGMYAYVALDLTSYLQDSNRLDVKIMPAPKRHAYPDDKTQASHVTKPAVSYGWDWHPRLIPLGIWDDTYLEIRYESYVNDVFIDYELSVDLTEANIRLTVDATITNDHTFRWELLDAQDVIMVSTEGRMKSILRKELLFTSPVLWWPHDHGIPYLYSSCFMLIDNDGEIVQTVKRKMGFRRVQLVMNEGAWDEPAVFPKTRSVPPAQLEINGRKIFAKGTNWVNPEIFPGIIDKSRYRELLNIVVETNFNIVRCWGGAVVNKNSFFELCDELGVMIWQEFPLSCNKYPDDTAYLSLLDFEARAIITRIRKHPSLVLWCGGNELFNSWSGMTDQSFALRLLNSLCYELDRQTPFIPTSPLYGIAHGNYLFNWKGQEIFEMINKSHHTAYVETGVPGLSPIEILEKIIPEDQLFPPRTGTIWEDHHAFNAWDEHRETWLCRDIINQYMEPASSLEELVYQSQLLQSEGYKAVFEGARRKKPYCSMVLNWCFNEPWPAAANNSLVSYPSVYKPSLAAVRNACRPVCASAVIHKFVWQQGELFTTDVWFLNDTFDTISGMRVEVSIQGDDQKFPISVWEIDEVKPNQNIAGPTLTCKLPFLNVRLFKLSLEVRENSALSSEYMLIYRAGT